MGAFVLMLVAYSETIAQGTRLIQQLDIGNDQIVFSFAEGRDAQLERAVEETMKLLEKEEEKEITPPPFSRPAVGPEE